MEKDKIVKKAFAGLIAKRKIKNSAKTKYSVRKEKTPAEYKNLKVRINGEDKNVSTSGKFLFDAMAISTNEETDIEIIDGQEKKKLNEISDYMLDLILVQK
jgi:hypothetical protein